ncbi:DNA repair protein RecO C-terminal domain-containing protein [Spiroplasma endosymbiont of Polydrusus pterygomalis]|uniref:DNA repair protein RecO C-terminal domain-containing protein n=1 Tax=Spiroplasma endosymbiont of Polydrusus pterygomalis TaxID=3139327 RepID=UPI003CCAC732
MFNIDTGLILNINYIKTSNNVTILTSKYGIKIVSLSEIKTKLNKYNILDCWIFIFNKNWCVPYQKVKSFNVLNKKSYYLIRSFNKIMINYLEKDNYNDKRIFSFLFNLYEQLIINSNFKKIYVFFLFHSLIFQGIQFNFTSCINCNQIINLYLVKYDLGGIVCKNCSLELYINSFDIILFKKLYQLHLLNYQDINKWEVAPVEINKIINILENHCYKYNNKLIFI